MTCVAFSIKFAKTNQKFAENSEFCENYSLLFKIIHWCPQAALRDLGAPVVDLLLLLRHEVLEGLLLVRLFLVGLLEVRTEGVVPMLFLTFF